MYRLKLIVGVCCLTSVSVIAFDSYGKAQPRPNPVPSRVVATGRASGRAGAHPGDSGNDAHQVRAAGPIG
jgi:hypothetical protein